MTPSWIHVIAMADQVDIGYDVSKKKKWTRQDGREKRSMAVEEAVEAKGFWNDADISSKMWRCCAWLKSIQEWVTIILYWFLFFCSFVLWGFVCLIRVFTFALRKKRKEERGKRKEAIEMRGSWILYVSFLIVMVGLIVVCVGCVGCVGCVYLGCVNVYRCFIPEIKSETSVSWFSSMYSDS